MWQPLCVTIVWVAIIWALALVPMLLSATLVIIPCDPNMTNYTTTLMSNTDYLIQDCTLSDLSPDSSSSDGGGNWMPPMHRFTALLSAPENATISNVDIVVRGGNVVPLLKIQPRVIDDTSQSTVYSVRNVSLLIVGSNIVWPASMQPNVVDTIFSMAYVFLRDVTLTLQECRWNLNYPNSETTGNNPILLYVLGPLLLNDSSSTEALLPGGVRVMLLDSNISVACSSPNTPSSFIALEMRNAVVDVISVSSFRSSLAAAVPIWLSSQLVSLVVLRLIGVARLQTVHLSNISVTISGSAIALAATLPNEAATDLNVSSVRIISVTSTNCSDVEVVINDSLVNLSLTRPNNVPSTLLSVSATRRLEVGVLSISMHKFLSRIAYCATNSIVVLQSLASAYCVALSASFVSANGTSSFLRNATVTMSLVDIRSTIAADGASNIGATAIIFSTDSEMMHVKIEVSSVQFQATAIGSQLSYASFLPLVTVTMFLSTTSLLSLTGNTTSSTVKIRCSTFNAEQRYTVPAGLATQFTATVMAIIYAPGAVSFTTIDVLDSKITIVGANEGIGATPLLSAASIASGSFNGNSVAILTTFSQSAFYTVLPPLVASYVSGFFASGSAPLDIKSILDAVTIHFINTSIATSDPLLVELSDSNLLIAAFGLTLTSMRNGVVVDIRNYSLRLSQLGTNDDGVSLRSMTCQANNIVTTGSGFGPVVGVFGSCVLEANTWIVVNGARGIVGPIISSYSLAQTAAVLTLQRNSSIQLTDVAASGLITEGSIVGKGSPSDAAGTFTVNIAEATMLMGVTGIFLSSSLQCISKATCSVPTVQLVVTHPTAAAPCGE